MKLAYKYTILYSFISCILLVALFQWIDYHAFCEPMTNDERPSSVNYDDFDSRTVDMPINNPFSCSNFCGPKSTCAITGEQCATDNDCPGCKPPAKQQSQCETEDVPGYEASGPLAMSNVERNPGYYKNYAEVYPNSKDAELTNAYSGDNKWARAFNFGLGLYNKKREFNNGVDEDERAFVPQYPTTTTATGLFYSTGPPASNM